MASVVDEACDAMSQAAAEITKLRRALINVIHCFDETHRLHNDFWEAAAESAAANDEHISSDDVRRDVLRQARLLVEPVCEDCGNPIDMPGIRVCTDCMVEVVAAIEAGEY